MTLPSLVLAASFLSFFEAKNTTANYILEPPEGESTVSTVKPEFTVRETCPACEGKGEIVLKEENFGQSNGRLGNGKIERRKCPVCNGRKKLESFPNPEDLALQVSRDRQQFESDHLKRGEIPVGMAYVPREIYEKVNADKNGRNKLKLVEEAYGKPCTTCHWTGLEPCRKCDGRGTITCPNSDCKGGWAVTKTTTSYSRSSSGGGIRGGYNRGGFSNSGGSRRISRKEEKVNVHVCPDCDGAHMIICPECQGRRAKTCRRCNGIGTKGKGYGL